MGCVDLVVCYLAARLRHVQADRELYGCVCVCGLLWYRCQLTVLVCNTPQKLLSLRPKQETNTQAGDWLMVTVIV